MGAHESFSSKKGEALPDRRSISDLFKLKKRINEFKNPDICKTLSNLQKIYPFYRAIRGDGNCLYRAIIYRYLELIIQHSDEELFNSMKLQIINSEIAFTSFKWKNLPPEYALGLNTANEEFTECLEKIS